MQEPNAQMMAQSDRSVADLGNDAVDGNDYAALAGISPMLKEAAGVFWPMWMIVASILAGSTLAWLMSFPRPSSVSFTEFCDVVGFGIIAMCIGSCVIAAAARAQLFAFAKLIDKKRAVARRMGASSTALAIAEMLVDLNHAKDGREAGR
jgi:hypothetical protein